MSSTQSQTCFSYIFSRNFIILAFKFRCLVHSNKFLCIVWTKGWESFYSIYIYIYISPLILFLLLKTTFFIELIFYHLLKINRLDNCGCIWGKSISYNYLFIYLYAKLTYSWLPYLYDEFHFVLFQDSFGNFKVWHENLACKWMQPKSTIICFVLCRIYWSVWKTH